MSLNYLPSPDIQIADDDIQKHRNADGTTIDPDFNFNAWREKHVTFARENVPKWVEAVKEKFGMPSISRLLSTPLTDEYDQAMKIRLTQL